MGRAILCVVIVCAWLGSARAAGDDAAAGAAAEAKRHFEEGTKLYNLGEFGAAAVEYKAAYKAKPDSVFLYNVAQALRLNNEPASALFFYRSYLRTTPNAANRKEVDRRIKELDALLVAQPKPAPAPSPTPPKVEAPTSPSK